VYEQLRPHEDARPVHDLGVRWQQLAQIENATPEAKRQIEVFCQMKGISLQGLLAQEAKLAFHGRGPDLFLAFPGYARLNGSRVVSAIKYRDVQTGKRKAEAGSSFGEVKVIGDATAMDWFIVEGETDGARLYDLVGHLAAVCILPAGASALRRVWFQRLPRGARVYICLDADEAGEAGSRKLMQILGNGIRVRPPGVKDWCEWQGGRDDFIALVKQERKQIQSALKTFSDLYEDWKQERSGERPGIRVGWGSVDHDLRGVSDGQVLGIAARTAVGKSWALATIAHNVSAANAGGLICSLEMPGPEWFERQWAIFENLPPEEIEKLARMDDVGPPTRFLQRMQYTLLCEKPLQLDDIPYVIQEARQRLDQPLRCVYVDYLGLLSAPGKDPYERTSVVGKGLKELAKQEHVAVIVAMQLSRKGGDGTQPVTLEMMRDSGVIEEAMDFLLGLWRPSLDSKDMLVRVLKNRKGASGRQVKLTFKTPSMQVLEVVA